MSVKGPVLTSLFASIAVSFATFVPMFAMGVAVYAYYSDYDWARKTPDILANSFGDTIVFVIPIFLVCLLIIAPLYSYWRSKLPMSETLKGLAFFLTIAGVGLSLRMLIGFADFWGNTPGSETLFFLGSGSVLGLVWGLVFQLRWGAQPNR